MQVVKMLWLSCTYITLAAGAFSSTACRGYLWRFRGLISLCKMLVRMRRNRDFVSFMGFYVVCRFSQILVSAPYWPIRSGQVLLLLELLLQAHQLQLSKNSTAATWLLQAGCAALSLRLAADTEGRLAGWQLGASGMLWGKQWQMWMGSARRGRLRDVSRQVGRLPRDHWEERVGT